MSGFGPFAADRHAFPVGIAVSGGADSLCLAWLMRRWRRAVMALVVDHGLRENSAAEAEQTMERLGRLDIPARLIRLQGLDGSRRLQQGAREARYSALVDACASHGVLDLALGHHCRDQVETYLLRQGHGSTAHGLAGMALARETARLRYLRPLLTVQPERLRATLRHASVDWIEDPSNNNPAFERVRIRQSLDPARRRAVLLDIATYARQRNVAQARIGDSAFRIRIDPAGMAVMDPLPSDTALLGRLWQAISGGDYPPSPKALEALIASPRPVTMAGGMLCRAGRYGPGWLLIREPQAVSDMRPAMDGILWDGRFRAHGMPVDPDLTIAALGRASRDFRHHDLPARVLATLPALWRGSSLRGVPTLDEVTSRRDPSFSLAFEPATCLTDSSFWPEYAQ